VARSQRPVEVNWSSCDLITDTLHHRPSDRRPELDARRSAATSARAPPSTRGAIATATCSRSRGYRRRQAARRN